MVDRRQSEYECGLAVLGGRRTAGCVSDTLSASRFTQCFESSCSMEQSAWVLSKDPGSNSLRSENLHQVCRHLGME